MTGAAADDAGGFEFGAVGIFRLPAEAFRSVFGGGRLRYPDTAPIVGGRGSMIRHAEPSALPIGPLPVAVIEPSFPALLVPLVGVPPLLPPRFPPASLAAVLVAPVTITADPEHHATAGPPAKPLTQRLFAGLRPSPSGGRGQPRLPMAISIPFADAPFVLFAALNARPFYTGNMGE